ncbi:MAG: EthD domain-containing protein [Pseudomonadota bacterium]
MFCLHRLPHLDRSAFQTYWRETHAPLVAQHAAALNIRKYVQTHARTHDANKGVQAARGAPEGFDGIAELWWDSWDSLAAATESPIGIKAGTALLKDEATFIDLKRSPLWFNEEFVFVDI